MTRDRHVSFAVRRMHRILPTYPPLRHRDPVAWVDLQTSLNDARAALCVALGVPLDEIHPVTGHDMQRDSHWVRADVLLEIANALWLDGNDA